jgi:hypothetical protein
MDDTCVVRHSVSECEGDGLPIEDEQLDSCAEEGVQRRIVAPWAHADAEHSSAHEQIGSSADVRLHDGALAGPSASGLSAGN